MEISYHVPTLFAGVSSQLTILLNVCFNYGYDYLIIAPQNKDTLGPFIWGKISRGSHNPRLL